MSDYTIEPGAVGVYILGDHDNLTVMSGGTSLLSVVGSGGREVVEKGGESSGDHVLGGGVAVLAQGAVANGDLVDIGGSLRGPGLAFSTTNYGVVAGVALSGNPGLLGLGLLGEDVLTTYGEERRVRIYDSATAVVAGRAVGDSVFSGGVEHVLEGGVSSDAQVLNGGRLQLDSGGAAAATRISAGGVEITAEGTVQNGLTVETGGTWKGAGVLRGDIVDNGIISGGTVAGGSFTVRSGGVAEDVHVGGHTSVTLQEGAQVGGLTLGVGVTVVDNGELDYTGTQGHLLKGTISGDGRIVQDSTRALDIRSDNSAFRGEFVLRRGIIEVEAAEGLGHARVDFDTSAHAAQLRLQGSAAPASGSTLANALVDFDSSKDRLDLRDIAFHAGATAKVSGSTLVVHDGAYTASFKLSGEHASAYVVARDAKGGTLIRARVGAQLVDAAAAFTGGGEALAQPTVAATGGHAFAIALAASAPTRPTHAV